MYTVLPEKFHIHEKTKYDKFIHISRFLQKFIYVETSVRQCLRQIETSQPQEVEIRLKILKGIYMKAIFIKEAFKNMKIAVYYKLFTAALAILSILLICRGSAFHKPDRRRAMDQTHKTTVTVWVWGEDFNMTAVREAAAVYQKREPDVSFEMLLMTQEEIEARLKSLLVTGSHRLLPDLVLIADYRIPYFLHNYKDEFLPLGDLIDLSEYALCKTGVNQIEGVVYGVPFDSGAAGLFYRLDLIRQAGFREQDMQDLTWEQYIRIGKKVKAKTGKAMLACNPADPALIRMLLLRAGSWYTDVSGRLDLAGNTVMEEAMRLYQKIVQSGITLTVADWNQFTHAFWEGEVATVMTGSWITASISRREQQKGLWRMTSVPRQEADLSASASAAGGSGWYIFRYADGAQQAKQFLAQTFASDQKLLADLTEKIGLVSAWNPAHRHAVYQKTQPFYGNQKIYQDLIRWTNEIPQVNYGAHTYEAELIVADALQQVLDGQDIPKVLAHYQKKYEW